MEERLPQRGVDSVPVTVPFVPPQYPCPNNSEVSLNPFLPEVSVRCYKHSCQQVCQCLGRGQEDDGEQDVGKLKKHQCKLGVMLEWW